MGFPSAVTTFLDLFQGWRSSVHVISIDASHCDDHRQVKDFNDEFRSLDKARTNSRGWSGLLWYGWGCWWKNFHKSMGSPFRLQSRKNMMNYEEILWVPLNYCRIFLLTSVFSSFGCFTTHLANGTIKQDVWLCQCTRGKCRCQWNPQTGDLPSMSGWKWSLGACRVWTLNGQMDKHSFPVILVWILLPPFSPRLFPVIVRLSQSKPFAVTHEQLLDVDMVVGTSLTD